MFNECKNLIPLLNDLEQKRLKDAHIEVVKMTEDGYKMRKEFAYLSDVIGSKLYEDVPRWLATSLKKIQLKEQRFIDRIVSRRLATLDEERQKVLEHEIKGLEQTFLYKWGYTINNEF